MKLKSLKPNTLVAFEYPYNNEKRYDILIFLGLIGDTEIGIFYLDSGISKEKFILKSQSEIDRTIDLGYPISIIKK